VKQAARVVAILAALGAGYFLLGAGPEDVTLVYDLAGASGARALEVELRRDGTTVRRAEFRFASGAPGQVTHPVKLPRGDYVLAWRLDAPAGPVRGDRAVTVDDGGTIVLSLGP
jgi:hypothetical protein